MPLPNRTSTWAGLALAALVVLAIVVAGSTDRRAAFAAAHEAPALLATGAFISRFGLSGYMLGLSAAAAAGAVLISRRTGSARVALRARRFAEQAIFFFASIAVSGLVCQAIKHLVGRDRPRFLQALGPFHFAGPTFSSGFESFPSGHSTTAFAAAVSLSLLRPAWAVAIYPAAILICVSRVFAQAHYPSDVVAGAVLGASVTIGVARVFAQRDVAFSVSDPLRLPSVRGLPGLHFREPT